MPKQVRCICANSPARANAQHSDDIFGSYILDSRPSSEFNFEAAKNKLVNIYLGAEGQPTVVFTTPEEELTGEARYGNEDHSGGTGRKGRLMRLTGWIDLDNNVSVGGGLVSAIPSGANCAADWLCWSYSELYFAEEECGISPR